MKDSWIPLIRMCTYGQDKEDNWDRYFRYIFSEMNKESVSLRAKQDAKNMGLNKWYSWGIDSRVSFKSVHTGDVDDLGRVLFLDCDLNGRGTPDMIRFLISEIQSRTVVSVEPDVYKTENGVHLYFFEMIDEDELIEIMDMNFLDDVVDPKFTHATKKLGSSVLRLSKKKKSEDNSIDPCMSHGEYDEYTEHVYKFVTRILNGGEVNGS